jgi:hypothetical protein
MLGVPSLALRLAEARRGWCMWYHHRDHVEMKLKTDRSMRQVASDFSTLNFVIFVIVGHKGNLVFCWTYK